MERTLDLPHVGVADWCDYTIAVCASAFVVVLAVAAYWDASIRVVHTFEAMPYIAVAILCVRRRKVGYALGVTAGLLWLGLAGRGSGLIESGFQVLAVSLRTHYVVRPDILIAVPGAIAAAGLTVSSAIGYGRLTNRRWSDAALFAAAAAFITAFFFGHSRRNSSCRSNTCSQPEGAPETRNSGTLGTTYFTFALAFRRSAQYFLMCALTAFRAAADICRPRCPTRLMERATLLRVAGSFSSGNVRSMAMISARSCFSAVAAPARASSFNRSVLSPLARLGTMTPSKRITNVARRYS
jgi:hypothetical protein